MNYKKDKIIIKINNSDKYPEIKDILNKFCDFSSESENLSKRYGKKENQIKHGVYKFKENHTLKELIKNLGKLCKYVTFKDIDSNKKLPYIGKLTIRFDKIDYVKTGTLNKIDELKKFKSDLGYCRGFKKNFRPMETSDARFINYAEYIFLVSASLENLLKLNLLLEDKLLKFDSNFELDFDLVD